MITVIAINAILAAAVFAAVIAVIVRAIRPQRTAHAGAPVRIVTFNSPTARERRALAEAA